MQLALFLCLLCVLPVGALDIERLDGGTIAALTREGPLVAISLGGDGRLRMATAATAIDAPPQRVWDVIEDFASYPSWMPQVQEAVVAEGGEGSATVAFELAFDLLVNIKVEYTLRYRRTGPFRMEYEQVQGDFAANNGYWVVEPQGEGCILYYASFVDYSSMRLLRAFLKNQPTLELGIGASSAAVVVRAVKERVER